MTAALVTENLALLASAPSGVQKLRFLVIELAIQGRLVPQDGSAESAGVLLSAISQARAKFYEASSSRPAKVQTEVGDDEQPFVLPNGWRWARLGWLAHPQAGFAFKSGGFNQDGRGLPLIRIRDVGQSFSGTFFEGDYRPEFVVDYGDYLISMDGEFRIAKWCAGKALLNQRVSRLQFFSLALRSDFVALALQARLRKLQGAKAYTTVDHLSGGQIADCVIGVPPLEEQHRIVAKVDELMALCDRLEAEQADAEAAHTKLVEALLASLTQARDAADFRASWQQLAEHFHTLFTTEASVDALKQAVLQLAVTGRVLPLDARFPDGSGESIGSTPLPTHWDIVPFNDLVDQNFPIAYGVLVPGPENADGVPFVRIADLSLNAPSQLPEKRISREVDAKFSRTRLVGGEILMGVVGSIGKLGIAPPSWAGANIARAICRIVPAPTVSREFVLWLLQSDLMRNQFIGDTRTLAQPTLNVGLIRAARTPLPPLAEQQRIVVMIDRMMALCDELQRSLVNADEHHQNLAHVLVAQAAA